MGGSLAATMLGRAGYALTLIDPFEHARPDFRCEKIEEPHAQRSVKLRSGARFAGAATPDQSDEILSSMVSCRVFRHPPRS
jgi:2-polyprenyl-6-methoxyphenol hydroxylase-like FAD-dependent oxidoreductase